MQKKTIFNQQLLAEILRTLQIIFILGFDKKKKIRIPCKMSFDMTDKYSSSVISPMFHQLDRGRVQLINSVGNA